MTLTDEQRAGLAKFLGEPYRAGCGMLCIATVMPDGRESWEPVVRTDAELMLALLERAAEQNYYVRIGPNHAPDYPGDFILRDWSASICELPFDPEREVTFYGATPLEAMVEGVLQLPEAQP